MSTDEPVTSEPITNFLGTTPIDMRWVMDESTIWVTTVLSCFVVLYSLSDTRQHSLNFTRPTLQRLTMRIQLMVPIYATFSLLCLHFPHHRFLLATIRDTYESFVLYEFLALLIAYCGGEGQLIHSLQLKRYKGEHPWPCCYLPMFALDRDFFLRCKRWVLQYALIKPIISAVSVVGAMNGSYRETDWDWGTNMFPWFSVIANTSISYSLWYLVVFHNETERELAYCRPMLKFVCIKTIIFFAFWQGLTINFLAQLGFINIGSEQEEEELILGATQDWLICMELIPVAFMHHYAFGYESFLQEMKDEPVFERIEGSYNRKNKKKGEKHRSDADILDAVEKARESEKQELENRMNQYKEGSLATKLKRMHSGVSNASNSNKNMPNADFRRKVLDAVHHGSGKLSDSKSNFGDTDYDDQSEDMENTLHRRNNNTNSNIPIDYDDLEGTTNSTNTTNNNNIQQRRNNNNNSESPGSTSTEETPGGRHVASMNTFMKFINSHSTYHGNNSNKDDDDPNGNLTRTNSMRSVGTAAPPSTGTDKNNTKPDENNANAAVAGAPAAAAATNNSPSILRPFSDGARVAGAAISNATAKLVAPLNGIINLVSKFDQRQGQKAQVMEDALDAVETSVLREALALQDFVSDTVQTIFYQGGGLLEAGGSAGGGAGKAKDNRDKDDEADDWDPEDENFDIDERYNHGGPKFIDTNKNDPFGVLGNAAAADGVVDPQLAKILQIIADEQGMGDESDSSDSEVERDEADARGAGWVGDPAMAEFENDGEYPLVPWYDYKTGRRREVLADGSVSQQHLESDGDAVLASAGRLISGTTSAALLSIKKIYDLVGGESGEVKDDEMFCTVCGRNDREMVQRHSGWKCVQCVGRKHQYFSGAASHESADAEDRKSKKSKSKASKNTSDGKNGKNGEVMNNITSGGSSIARSMSMHSVHTTEYDDGDDGDAETQSNKSNYTSRQRIQPQLPLQQNNSTPPPSAQHVTIDIKNEQAPSK